MNIDLIAGTRPNFVKIAAIIHAIENYDQGINFRFIHTGQHYDDSLSGIFIRDLELPYPDFNLGVGSGSQAEQTAALMTGYEKLILENKPDLCLVVGDVTSSMACAVTAKKLGIRIAHIEAGLRSYDWSMPEEINRVLIDSIADYFFTTTPEASRNLIDSGINKENIFFVGNTMIDTLLRFKPKFKAPEIWKKLSLEPKQYFILTLHRPVNVDEEIQLKNTINAVLKNTYNLPIIFPVHPRTAELIKKLSFKNDNLLLINPLGYLEFNYLVQNAKAVLTDSGGITEETTILEVPCLTLREHTERPETVELGTNQIVGTQPEAIREALQRLYNQKSKKGEIPELWDGKTGKRIVKILMGQQPPLEDK